MRSGVGPLGRMLLAVSLLASMSLFAASTPERAAANGPGGHLVLRHDGSVVAVGDTSSFGGIEHLPGAEPVAIETVAGTSGYYVVEASGRITAFGGAAHHGDLAGVALVRPIVDISVAPDGSAYYLTASDGGVFAFGPGARFHGSLPQHVPVEALAAPVVAIVVTPAQDGYWLIAADGGVFAFGAAPFIGSIPEVVPGPLNAEIIGAVRSSSGAGYGLIGRDGGVFAFGDFTFSFSAANTGASFVDIAVGGTEYSLLEETGGLIHAGAELTATGGTAVSFAVGGPVDPAAPVVPPATTWLRPFGRVSATPAHDLNGVGSDIDSIAFWEAPDPQDTLMFVTSKGTPLVEVWEYPFVGAQRTSLRHSTFGTGNTEVNGVVVDQERDLLYVSTSAPQSTVSVFRLPGREFVGELVQGRLDLAEEPNLDLYVHHDGSRRLYLTADTVVHVIELDTNAVRASFGTGGDVEAVLADEYWGRVVVPDEQDQEGVFVFSPLGGPSPGPLPDVLGAMVFETDGEGLVLYTANSPDDGSGFMVVSDQRGDATDFEFFDRRTGAHLGTLNLAGVTTTDGVASTQQASPAYPRGVFAALNDDTSVAVVGWDVVFDAIGHTP